VLTGSLKEIKSPENPHHRLLEDHNMSVSIKVAVRCRPFVCDDKLGVHMLQNSEEDGEINLLKSKYSTTRFGFTWAWWTAYGYKRHMSDDDPDYGLADSMELIDQKKVYGAAGAKIKADLYEGNAVVIFAYGLSGSGKTFTVFGPDAADAPEAWFKHMEPFGMWGIFPNLAYEVFQDRKDGWKVKMKYFQNVVDTIRDLMSPVAKEQTYKSGMRKDKDGFTDVVWCLEQVLTDWPELCKIFQVANGRKAIAPTQFNPMSTRGHCIMTLEVEKPNDNNKSLKQKGRLYVCDLAGTEPAGDIFFANYKKKWYEEDGEKKFEYELIGPNKDTNKTKQLQDQGKKINLSLTEMAQFFMKMASAIKKKKLKPGKSIPGCNSYFLCKYLKDTMMQARTYLFCAIRPEVKYLSYTFSTLGFAKNASVIKLSPKKATVSASPMEKKMMAELQKMQALMDSMKKENDKLKASGGDGHAGSDADVAKLKAELEAKQNALQDALNNEGSKGNDAAEQLQRQKEEYARRGITLKNFAGDNTLPYFINLDEDGFRDQRFLFIFTKPETVIGPGGDISPMSYSITKNHATVTIAGNGDVILKNGQSDTYVNGKLLDSGASVTLQTLDRIALANEIFLFRNPSTDSTAAETHIPTADEAAEELRSALRAKNANQNDAFQEQLRAFEEEKKKFAEQRQSVTGGEMAQATEAKLAQAKAAIHQELLDLVPKIRETHAILKLLNREYLVCEATMQDSLATDYNGVPIVKVKITNQSSGESIVLDPFEFVKAHAVLNDEASFLKGALAAGNDYYAPDFHEPVTLFFDHSFQLGTSIFFIEYLIYMFPSEDGDIEMSISNVVSPHQDVGKLEIVWTPLADEDDEGEGEVPEIGEPSELIGKPWTYKIEIKHATELLQMSGSAYCQYDFFGETFTTECIEDHTHSPTFNYEYIHHIENVTQEFIDFLSKPFHVNVFITPYISNPPRDKVSTNNDVIVGNITGKVVSMKSLRAENTKLKSENERLVKENNEFRAKLGMPIPKAKLEAAKTTDKKVNG
jgi:hypothetical protein